MALVSCQEKPGKDDDGKKLPEIKTCAENLVAYFPLESATNAVVAKGISFDKKAGQGDFAKGEIGNGYVNKAGNNSEAYLKFKLEKDNPLASLTDVTITMWLNNVEDFQKGGIISVNGKHFSGQDWPSMVVMFDNKSVDAETGSKNQQINGRFMFKNSAGTDTNMWLDTWDPAFAKYATWMQVAFTYVASTGEWHLYVDGVKIKDAEYGDRMPFGGCIPADANALYVGGWSSWIESYQGAADWQSFFSGSIDEIRFFNKALSEQEIQALRKEEIAIALS